MNELQYPQFLMGVGAMGDPLRGDIWAVTLEVQYDGPRSAAFEAALRASVQATTEINFLLW